MHFKNIIPAEQNHAIDDAVNAVLCGWRKNRSQFWAVPCGGPATFAGGGNYKIELVGPNNSLTLDVLLDMMYSCDVPVRRVIGTLGGLGQLSDIEIRMLADTSYNRKIEFIATPLMPLTNVEGRHPSEGSWFGLRLRGAKSIREYLYQMMRGINCGLRNFLVWDDVILHCVHLLQEQNIMPHSVQFKVSIFAGVTNAFGFNSWVDQSALVTSVNPVALSLDDFAELRGMSHGGGVPIDIHNNTVLTMAGLDRTHEIHKIIRVAAPVNVKIERGENVAALMDERTLVHDVFPLVVESAKKLFNHIKEFSDIKPG